MPEAPSKREQNRVENRRALIQAALSVFATIGFESCTVRDIVDVSELSRGTFYNYFGDKETALAAVAEDIVERIRVDVRQARRAANTPDALIRDAFSAMVAAISRDPAILPFISRNGEALRTVVADLEPTAAITAELQQDLEQAVAAGLLPPHKTEWLASAMVGAGIEVATRLPATEDPALAGEFLSTLFLSGIDGLRR
jgi:AcrR family transcriptional regulator